MLNLETVWAERPFCAERGTLSFYVGAVDGGVPRHCPRVHQRIQQL